MKKNILFIIVITLHLSLIAEPAVQPPLIYPEAVSPRLSALGGGFTCLVSGVDTLFTNPANFAFTKSQWEFSRLAIRTSSLFYEILTGLNTENQVKEIISVLKKNNGIYADCSITGPISLGMVNKNFGFGVFNKTSAIFSLPALSHVDTFLGTDVFLLGGFGANVLEKKGNEIALGFQFKGFLQTYGYVSGGMPISIYTLAQDGQKALPICISSGFGVDAGFTYRYKTYFSFAISIKDIYTPVFLSIYKDYEDYFNAKQDGKVIYKTFFPNLSAGISINAFPENYLTTISSWIFYMDFRNMLEPIKAIHKNPILNFACGTEMIFHKVVALRCGLQDCYPHAGFGLDFTYFKFDFSVYGKELGLEPGSNPLFNIELGISFKY